MFEPWGHRGAVRVEAGYPGAGAEVGGVQPAVGLALGGGAARGWAHIGVLRRLLRAGIVPEVIAGTSIGALVGGCWAAGRLDELEEWALRLTKRRMLGLLDLSLAGAGLIAGSKLRDNLQRNLGDTLIEDVGCRLVAVATEIGTGHEVWLTRGRLCEAIRASYALPGLFEPVRIGSRWLMDGALVNPVPVTAARALGARLVIAVVLHSEVSGRGAVVPSHGTDDLDHFAAEKFTLERKRPRLNAARTVLLRPFRARPDGPPGISSVMIDAFNVTQDRIARSRLAGDPPDVMIGPRLARIGLFEFHRAAEAIRAGEEAAERALPAIEDSLRLLA